MLIAPPWTSACMTLKIRLSLMVLPALTQVEF